MEDSEEELGNIVQDAQLFQDAALEYQIAYQSLEDKYTHQAKLMKEASEAFQASDRPGVCHAGRIECSEA